MDAKPSFGQRVKAWRKAKKFTQHSLAKAANMHHVTIAQFETDVRGKSPTWDTIQKIAVALGITAETLMGSMPNEAKEDKAAGESAAAAKKSSKAPKAKPSRPRARGKGA